MKTLVGVTMMMLYTFSVLAWSNVASDICRHVGPMQHGDQRPPIMRKLMSDAVCDRAVSAPSTK